MIDIEARAARHVGVTQYWAVSGDRCTCRVGREPGYDGHSHTDVVQACEECCQAWPCDARLLADELAAVRSAGNALLDVALAERDAMKRMQEALG